MQTYYIVEGFLGTDICSRDQSIVSINTSRTTPGTVSLEIRFRARRSTRESLSARKDRSNERGRASVNKSLGLYAELVKRYTGIKVKETKGLPYHTAYAIPVPGIP